MYSGYSALCKRCQKSFFQFASLFPVCSLSSSLCILWWTNELEYMNLSFTVSTTHGLFQFLCTLTSQRHSPMLSSKGFIILLFTSRFLVNRNWFVYSEVIIWENFLPIWRSNCATIFTEKCILSPWTCIASLEGHRNPCVPVSVFSNSVLWSRQQLQPLTHYSMMPRRANPPILLFRNIFSLWCFPYSYTF